MLGRRVSNRIKVAKALKHRRPSPDVNNWPVLRHSYQSVVSNLPTIKETDILPALSSSSESFWSLSSTFSTLVFMMSTTWNINVFIHLLYQESVDRTQCSGICHKIYSQYISKNTASSQRSEIEITVQNTLKLGTFDRNYILTHRLLKVE